MIGNLSRAVCYVRVSTEEQAGNTSPEYQREECRKKAAAVGAQVIAVCEDLGVSGTRYTTRPGIQEALAYIERGEADALIAFRLDRIGRSARVTLDIAERIDRAGGRLVTCDGMELGGTPAGKLALTTFAGFAEFERNTIRARTMAGRSETAKKGIQPARGRRPFGYYLPTHADIIAGRFPSGSEGTYIAHETESLWVQRMYREYAAGASLRGLCALLTANGVPTTAGNIWNRKGVMLMLRNPLYKGVGAYGRTSGTAFESGDSVTSVRRARPAEEWNIIAAPALVSEDLWDAVQERMARARADYSGRPDRKYMLSGFVLCPSCGQRMAANASTCGGNGGKRHTVQFRCRRAHTSPSLGGPTCDYRPRHSVAIMDSLVLRALTQFSESPDCLTAALLAHRQRQAEEYDAEEYARVEAQLRDTEAREQKTIELQLDAATAGLDAAIYTRKLQTLGAAKADLRKRLAELEARRNAADSAAAAREETEAETLRGEVQRLRRVLSDERLTGAARHDLLAGVVDSILPDKEAVTVNLRPVRPYSPASNPKSNPKSAGAGKAETVTCVSWFTRPLS